VVRPIIANSETTRATAPPTKSRFDRMGAKPTYAGDSSDGGR
jgi:hypothetical protein